MKRKQFKNFNQLKRNKKDITIIILLVILLAIGVTHNIHIAALACWCVCLALQILLLISTIRSGSENKPCKCLYNRNDVTNMSIDPF